ncbi:MAG: HEAT repeat domain-containing protein [Gammaproteobacteria bacterium]|nr:HEAT repeat domain-containing protein [Gammaproteobacteria bacterium]
MNRLFQQAVLYDDEKSDTTNTLSCVRITHIMWEALIDSLKTRYQDQAKALKRPIAGEDWRITDSFIQLALVLPEGNPHTHSADKKKNALDWHELYVNPAEKITQAKKALAYTQLFAGLPEAGNLPVQKIWVSGAAGSGKSTLMQRMAYEWSAGEKEAALWLPKSVGCVIWAKLRALKAYLDLDDVEASRLTATQKENIQAHRLRYDGDGQLELLPTLAAYLSSKRYGWSRAQECAPWQAFLEHSAGQVLWLIDGYDEIASLPLTHPVQVIFHELLLQQPCVMVTSRPYYRCPLETAIKPFRQVELLGFSQANVITYVDKHFEKQQDNPGYPRLKTLLTEHLKTRGLAHIPVNLEILCSVMSGGMLPDFSGLNTTQLYTQLFVHLMKRAYDANTLSVGFIPVSALTDDQTFLSSSKVQCLLRGLGALALEKLKNSQVQFEASELKAALRSVMEDAYGKNEEACFHDMFYSGLVAGLAWYPQQKNFRGQGEFLHLTLQEYLAAWVFAEQWKVSPQAVISFVQEYKYDVHFARFWPFVMGRLVEEPHSASLDALVTQIDSAPLPLSGTSHTILRIRCLDELLSNNVPLAWQSFVNYLSFNGIKEGHYHYNASIRGALRQSPAWGNQLALLLAQSLSGESVARKKETSGWLSPLGKGAAWRITQCLSVTMERYIPYGQSVIINAANALMTAPSSLVMLASLTGLLQDNNVRVCAFGCSAVAALGTEAATPAILGALEKLLQNEDANVRASACGAVGRLGSAAATPGFLKILAKLLQDDHKEVCSSACEALCSLIKFINPTDREILLTRLESTDTREFISHFLTQIDKPLSIPMQAYLLEHRAVWLNDPLYRFERFPFVLHAKRHDGCYPVSRLNHRGQFAPDCTVYLSEQEVGDLLAGVRTSQEDIDLPLSLALFSRPEESAPQSSFNPPTTPEKQPRQKQKKKAPPVTQLFFQQAPTLHFDRSPVYASHLAPTQMVVIGQAYTLPTFPTQSGEMPMKKTSSNEAHHKLSSNNAPQSNGALISARLIEVKNKITTIQEQLRFSQGLGKETTDAHLRLLLNRLQEEEVKMGGGFQSNSLIIADKITTHDMVTILMSIEAIENQIPVLSSSPPLQRGSINPGIVGGLYAQSGASSVAQVEGISYTKAEEKIHVIDLDYVDLPLNEDERLALQPVINNEGKKIFGYIADSVVEEEDCVIQLSFRSENAAKKCQKLIEQAVLRLKGATPFSTLLPQG